MLPPSVWLAPVRDRKSTRLNSSHLVISYAVFCLKKKKIYELVVVEPELIRQLTTPLTFMSTQQASFCCTNGAASPGTTGVNAARLVISRATSTPREKSVRLRVDRDLCCKCSRGFPGLCFCRTRSFFRAHFIVREFSNSSWVPLYVSHVILFFFFF